MILKSDDIVKLYGHMQTDLLQALKLPKDWIIKKIGPYTKDEWKKMDTLLNKEYRLLSYNRKTALSDFENLNIAISPVGERILKDYMPD